MGWVMKRVRAVHLAGTVSVFALWALPALADAAVEDVSALVVVAPTQDPYVAARLTSATKTDTPLVNIPQAISVITDEIVRDQAMQGMADVVRYVPGVSMGQGEGHRDAPTLRGNASTADFFVDGVRDDVQYFRDLYNVERVEVLKGPNAMIFGRGGGGGVINRVMKKAVWSDAREFTAETGSNAHARLTGDLGQDLGRGFSGRVVALYEDSGSYRDFVQLQRWGVTPSLGWRNDRLTVVVAYERFNDDRTVDRGLPSLGAGPSPADRSAFFGDPDQSFSRARVDLLNLAAEYQLAPEVVLRNRTVYGEYDKYYQNIYPSSALNAATGRFSLAAYSTGTKRENLFSQTDLVWKTQAGGMDHTLLLGAELGRQETDNRRLTGYFGNVSTSLSAAFSAPTVRDVSLTFRPSATDADNRVRAQVAAVYLQDQVELVRGLQLVLGLRFDSFDLDYRDNRSPGRFSRKDSLWSPRAGLVVKPQDNLSFYASYSISYLPSSGDQFASLTATTASFKPESFRNYELGVKWQPRPGLEVGAAVYQLDRRNTTAPDPANPARLLLTGAQRSRGLEASIAGQLSSRWSILGGYAWQEAEITRTTAAAPQGREVPLVPEYSASLWNKYAITERFSLGIGVIHQSSVFTSISNAVKLPGFTRADAAVFVRLNDRLDAQVNVENLFDRRYYPTSHGDNNILPGAPRSVKASLRARF